jgi:hypothetical protein
VSFWLYLSIFSLNLGILFSRLSVEYVESILKALVDHTGQDNNDPKILKFNPVHEIEEGRSSSLVGHWLYEPKVAGSSPARPTTTWTCLKFKTLLSEYV